MKVFNVRYNGNCTRLKNLNEVVNAIDKRDAVETVFSSIHDSDYFPQDDGTIQNASGDIICQKDDDTIMYDGGWLFAEKTEEN